MIILIFFILIISCIGMDISKNEMERYSIGTNETVFYSTANST